MTPRSESDCCEPGPDPRVARRFDSQWSDFEDGEEFPRMVDVSAGLLDRLRDAPIVRPTVLEIGSGTGGMSVALLEMGARAVRGVDLSPASVEVARRRARAGRFDEQADFTVGEGVAAGGGPYDWVILDRVLCCDGRGYSLLEAAIRLARQRIAISVPESRGWRGLLNRPMWAAETVWDLARGGCRGYVHDLRRMERAMADAGFLPTGVGHVGMWHVGVYQRG